MRRILQAGLLTSLIAAGALACATSNVCAQMDQMGDVDAAINFDSFQDQLAPYGYWLYSDRWGIVWQPADVPYDFRPYYNAGHWVYTDEYGWYWLSDYRWGDIPFHYGRWVDDPDDGWLWIPGYMWSPGWVAWRTNGSVIGWMPLPPDDAFLEGRGDIGIGFRFGGFDYGALYARWYGPRFDERRFAENWVFVPAGFVAVQDYRRVVIRDPVRLVTIIRQTRNVTNYTVVNNFVVNRSIDVHVVERAAGHPIQVVRAATVIRRPNLVASIAVGQRVQMRMRAIVPRGRGTANSAPPPTTRVVAKLSVNVPQRNGRAPVHLFTKATVTAPEAQTRFHGAPVRGEGDGGGGAMQGPNSERMRSERPNTPPGNEQQPNGMGPADQQSRERKPGGAMAPTEQESNGMSGPNAQRPHEHQPGGATVPTEQQSNGMSGPNAQQPHEHQPGSAMAPTEQQPNGMSGPNAQRPHEHQPGSAMAPGEQQSNGMSGPNAQQLHEHQPGSAMAPGEQQPNSMTAPNGPNPRGEEPNGATGPNGNGNPQNGAPQQHKKKKEQKNPPPQNPPQ